MPVHRLIPEKITGDSRPVFPCCRAQYPLTHFVSVCALFKVPLGSSSLGEAAHPPSLPIIFTVIPILSHDPLHAQLSDGAIQPGPSDAPPSLSQRRWGKQAEQRNSSQKVIFEGNRIAESHRSFRSNTCRYLFAHVAKGAVLSRGRGRPHGQEPSLLLLLPGILLLLHLLLPSSPLHKIPAHSGKQTPALSHMPRMRKTTGAAFGQGSGSGQRHHDGQANDVHRP